MNNQFIEDRRGERGGAGIKFLIVGVMLFLAAYAAINYIPTAYNAQSFKQDIQTAIIQASAMPPTAVSLQDNIKGRILKAAASNNVPPNPFVEVKQSNGIVQARVYYVKNISLMPFGIYDYPYQFDYTVTPGGFLFKQ